LSRDAGIDYLGEEAIVGGLLALGLGPRSPPDHDRVAHVVDQPLAAREPVRDAALDPVGLD
jgi:hypothetical protein